jgi:hypothetical protein
MNKITGEREKGCIPYKNKNCFGGIVLQNNSLILTSSIKVVLYSDKFVQDTIIGLCQW